LRDGRDKPLIALERTYLENGAGLLPLRRNRCAGGWTREAPRGRKRHSTRVSC